MKPYLDDPDVTLYQGDALAVLRELPEASVDCCVTSPPYWGLRDYGTAEWEGGDAECDHVERVGGKQAPAGSNTLGRDASHPNRTSLPTTGHALIETQYRDLCAKCGAQRVDQQIGLETTCDEFVEVMVEVFREVRRVLAPHGTLWLNLGDTYAAKQRGTDNGWERSRLTNPGRVQKAQAAALRDIGERHRGASSGLKEKDLVGIPWLVAFALRADGWWLRAENVWSKPNPMPESVTDRPAKSHEQVFLLARSGRELYWTNSMRGTTTGTKPSADPWWFPPLGEEAEPLEDAKVGEREREALLAANWKKRNAWLGHDYYYDGEAVRESVTGNAYSRGKGVNPKATINEPGRGVKQNASFSGSVNELVSSRSMRSVWEIATQGFPDAHFATFPEELPSRAIRAGCPERVCTVCGVPSERVLERRAYGDWGRVSDRVASVVDGLNGSQFYAHYERPQTVGWTDCGHDSWRPGVVLDPFMGSGTTALVARKLGRHAVGIDLSAEYLDLAAEKRLAQQSLLA